MARRYDDLTRQELADGLTVPVLLKLWPLLLQTSALAIGGRPELGELSRNHRAPTVPRQVALKSKRVTRAGINNG